jgi:hypothetical protein
VEKAMHAVFNVRSEPTAEAWLAAILARSKFGIAIAAIIRMIATTIKSSISEKPFCLFRILFSLARRSRFIWPVNLNTGLYKAFARPFPANRSLGQVIDNKSLSIALAELDH